MIGTTTSARFLVLNALAVKGVASEAALAEVTGLNEEEVTAEVGEMLEAGYVRRRKGRLGGLSLLDAGRAEHRTLLALDVGEEAKAVLAGVYESFRPVNGRFKDLCTRWQLRGPEPNDHADAAYDAGAIGELTDLHTEATTFLEPAVRAIARFRRYPLRLGAALDRVRNGEVSAFTKPLSDSYHDVWMELHQDLLTSLDRTRNAGDEG
jgi:DNA-binding MarR family transcriptional regulator